MDVTGKSRQAARAQFPVEFDVRPLVFKGRVEFAHIRDIDGRAQWPGKVCHDGAASLTGEGRRRSFRPCALRA